MARKVPNSFLYFLADGDVDIPAGVREVLTDRLGGWHKRPAKLGEKTGALITAVNMAGVFESIDETAQSWVEIADHPGLYVGMWKGHRPTEEDLRRQGGVLGPKTPMLDGKEWTLPVLMYDTGDGPASLVPSSMVYQDGQWKSHIREEFKPIASIALNTYSVIVELLDAAENNRKATVSLTVGKGAEFVAQGLAINYRVGREEIGLLGILDHQLILQHAGVMVGRNMIKKILEINEDKKRLGELVSTRGNASSGTVV